ncbi:uncharacterized protein B0P05DRAFT_612229, partial [Gilbertella persicaria]|uniref:uncharacterized protein n=1 Tax=Gilbertella persicaria TaxID=101096 RepID=UPI00221EA3B0
FSLLYTIATAATLKGKIISNAVIEVDVSKIDSSTTRVALNGAQHIAHITSKGEFTFPNVKPGSYLLEVQSIQHIYPRLRVDIDENDNIRASYTGIGNDWNQRGYSVSHPFELQAKAEAEYFMQRQGFNVMGMFKNPMFLMLGFSAIMMFFMPKIMSSLQDMGKCKKIENKANMFKQILKLQKNSVNLKLMHKKCCPICLVYLKCLLIDNKPTIEIILTCSTNCQNDYLMAPLI